MLELKTNPYKVPQPFVVSLSGGRTSGFLLWHVLSAFGGSIPDGSHVVFANTGKEHEATLVFLNDIAREWNVDIAWVERMFDEPNFKVTDFQNANRDGGPFEQLIKKRNFLPNPMMRFCTSELKVRPIADYIHSLGISDATMVVGLRADEPRRVHRVQGDVRFGFDYACPMYAAGHNLKDVMAFWSSQTFDLKLPNDDRAFGNCDLCFLKGSGVIERVLREEPHRAQWWIDREEEIGATFRKDRPTYRQTLHQIRIQPTLFGNDDSDTIPCTCTD